MVLSAPRCPSCGAQVQNEGEFCVNCTPAVSSTAPAATSEPICPHCGTTNPADAVFCLECGQGLAAVEVAGVSGDARTMQAQPSTPLFVQPQQVTPVINQAQVQACNYCGAWNRPGLRFCETCGKPLDTAATPSASQKKSRKVLFASIGGGAFLALLFLGWFLWGASVTIASNPPGARVFIDGEEVGQTSVTDGRTQISHLGRGQHTLRVERNGFTASEQTFDLGLTEFSRVVEIKLAPSVFALTIITDPPGCSVSLDSGEKGTTDSNGEMVLTDVARGAHSLTLSRDGYQDWKREITLDSSQMIRANLTPQAEEPPVEVSTDSAGVTSSSESEVDSMLRSWAGSLSNRDLDSNMSHYAERLDSFLTMGEVTHEQVRASRMKLFGKYSSISVKLSNIHINVDSSGTSAMVTLDNDYNFRGSKSLTGKAQNEIRLEKRGDRWLITSERHVQTYFETSS